MVPARSSAAPRYWVFVLASGGWDAYQPDERRFLDDLELMHPDELALMARVLRKDQRQLEALGGGRNLRAAEAAGEAAALFETMPRFSMFEPEDWSRDQPWGPLAKGTHDVGRDFQRALWTLQNDVAKVVYMRRYVQRKLVDGASGAPPAPTFLTSYPSATGTAPDTQIELLPETRAMLDQHCLECHSSTNPDPTKNFEMRALSRERLLQMLEHVADGRMPKTTAGLAPEERHKAMTVLISNLWSDDADRRAAFDYYDERLASAPVHRPEAVLSLIYERPGSRRMSRSRRCARARPLTLVIYPHVSSARRPSTGSCANNERDRMKTRLLVSVAFTLACIGTAYAGPADDVKAAANQVRVAQIRADIKTLDGFFADDLMFIHASGALETKAEFLDSLKSGKRKLEAIDQEDVKLRVYDATVVVTGKAHIRAVSGGKTLDNNVRFAALWVEVGSKWKIVSYQATIIRPPPPPPTPPAVPPAPPAK